MPNTITLSKFIVKLQNILEEEGDLKVLLATDEEGNSFGTIDPSSDYETDIAVDTGCGVMILYPCSEISNVDEVLADTTIDNTKENKHRRAGDEDFKEDYSKDLMCNYQEYDDDREDPCWDYDEDE